MAIEWLAQPTSLCEGIIDFLQAISKLLTLLQANSSKLILETALQALASVADCAEEQFKKYYSSVIPLLKHILEAATGDDQQMIRAKALECVSLVGMAVGKDQFREDAKAVMQLLISLDHENGKADDPTISFKLQVGDNEKAGIQIPATRRTSACSALLSEV